MSTPNILERGLDEAITVRLTEHLKCWKCRVGYVSRTPRYRYFPRQLHTEDAWKWQNNLLPRGTNFLRSHFSYQPDHQTRPVPSIESIKVSQRNPTLETPTGSHPGKGPSSPHPGQDPRSPYRTTGPKPPNADPPIFWTPSKKHQTPNSRHGHKPPSSPARRDNRRHHMPALHPVVSSSS